MCDGLVSASSGRHGRNRKLRDSTRWRLFHSGSDRSNPHLRSGPNARRFGLYLSVAAALQSKPPALISPALLFVYIWIWLVEEDANARGLARSAVWCIPSLLAAALAYLQFVMTPREFPSAVHAMLAYNLNCSLQLQS
jgi:hypothetical protein